MKQHVPRLKKPTDSHNGKLSEEGGINKSRRRNTKSCEVKGKSADVTNKGASSSEITEVPTSGAGQIRRLIPKLKLQLFPIDDNLRKGLQADGYNPHLELTLGGRKKISSVVRHLISKWGNSRVAFGELMLFPCGVVLENISECMKWSLKDDMISVIDIYRTMGCPAILRLRYGWFVDGLQKLDISSGVTVASEDRPEPCPETNQKFTPGAGDLQNLVLDKQMPPERYVDEKTKTVQDAIILWTDNLTNMSFGDLLARAGSFSSEASQACQLPVGASPCPQQIPFSCDSFDAAIAAQLTRMKAPMKSAEMPTSSILDAEVTNHAFPSQRNPKKDELLLSSGNTCGSFSQIAFLEKPVVQSSLDLGSRAQEEESPILQLLEPDNDCKQGISDVPSEPLAQSNTEGGIGLGNIYWDSLGPMDFSLPMRINFSGNESISFSNLLSSSRDALRSCSLSNS